MPFDKVKLNDGTEARNTLHLHTCRVLESTTPLTWMQIPAIAFGTGTALFDRVLFLLTQQMIDH
jgi:hypothetical protein